MKKTVKGWELNDYDGHFTPDAFGPDGGESLSIYPDGDLRIERTNGEVGWVPVEVVAEYLRMLGWIVIAPEMKK
jgi:hypothetical protein